MKRKISRTTIFVLLLMGAVIMAFPFYYMVITSFKTSTYIFSTPPQLIPNPATFDNYKEVWNMASFSKYFLNSTIIVIPAVLLNVFLSSLTAYGFARFKFPGKELWYTVLLATLSVPGILLIIPQFNMISHFKFFMDNKFTIILTSGIGGIAFNAFFLRGYYESMPVEYEESAEIDGCNAFQTYFYIALPQSLPAIASLIIMSFLGVWDDYFWPSLILRSKDNWTLPIGIMALRDQHSVQWNLIFAGTMISLIPVLIIYFVFQKYFIKTVSEGGLKM